MIHTVRKLLPRFALLTLVLLYLVVLAGSIVRATGSGMGCPDWPRCYGRLIPPTEARDIDFSRLDLEKYRKSWSSHGRDGVEVTEESVRANFNARETWTEFLNRCVGALSGLAALLTLAAALMVPGKLSLRLLLAGQMVLFGFTAWLGKVVVDTNLLPWKITLHMVLALALITTALLALHLVRPGRAVLVTRSVRWHLLACLGCLLIQVIVGTQVREAVDHLGAGQCCDGRVEERLGSVLVWHRVGAIATLTLVAVAFFRLKFRAASDAGAPLLITLLGLLVAVEYGVGVLLIRAEMPAYLQPVHLFFGFVLHGIILTLLLRSRLQNEDAAPTLAAAS